jgi:hypothetical protein
LAIPICEKEFLCCMKFIIVSAKFSGSFGFAKMPVLFLIIYSLKTGCL